MPANRIAIVPARAGSKGFPSKNVAILGAKPLYQIAIEQGLRLADEVIFTTDIEDIPIDDLPPRCRFVRRSPELATDDATMEHVMTELVNSLGLSSEILLLLQPTSPLRTDDDIRSALSLFNEGHHHLVATVSEIDSNVLKSGFLSETEGTFIPLSSPDHCFSNRQDLPRLFKFNGAVFVMLAHSVTQSKGFPKHSLGAVEMPKERSLDIDSAKDLEIAKKCYKIVAL